MKKILLTLALVVAAVVSAQAADDLYNPNRVSNVPTLMTTVSTSNSLSSTPITLQRDMPIGIWGHIAGTNSTAISNVIFTFQVGHDGVASNFATTPTLTFTNTPNGTNQIVTFAIFNTNQLQGVRTIRLFSVQNLNTQSVQIGPLYLGEYRQLH